jgi:hypothetical protein
MDPHALVQNLEEKVIQALNIGHLSKAEQGEVIEAVGEMIFSRVLGKILTSLPESELPKFKALVEAKQGDAVQAMIDHHIPNAAQVLQQEVESALNDYATNLKKVMERDAAAGENQ